MSAIQKRLTNQLRARGVKNPKEVADKKLTDYGILKDGKLTAKGQKRNSMTPEQRSNDRAAKRSGHKASDYKYNKNTNRSKLKKS